MSTDFTKFEGYSPTLKNILEELEVDSQEGIREKVLKRCEALYDEALFEDTLKVFQSIYDFIICESSQFYKVFVDMGQGNCALTIRDELSSDKYFLLFADKVPRQFYQIVARHEITEYEFMQEGVEQGEAHLRAEAAELYYAERLGLKESYLDFLESNYPARYLHLQERFGI